MNPPITLRAALPELAGDVEGGLIRLGRGSLADQLRTATLVSWAFDEFAQATYLALVPKGSASVEETISLYDDLPVNVDVDKNGCVVGLDVVGYEEALARLGESPTG
jgi:uncharacterized protein YuzE